MINKAIISVLVAFLLFNTFDISWMYYSVTFLIGSVLVFINFRLSKNHSLYSSLFTINLLAFVVYCTINFAENGMVTQTGVEEIWFLLILIILAATGFFLFLEQIGGKKNENENENPTLLFKREKDLNLFSSYVENFKIIGLNGRWGTGKSFIMDALKDRIKEDYEFIEIDLMTCNLNEMQPTLIRAFEEVMYKNRILPKYAYKLKNNIESSSFFSKLQDLTNLFLVNSDSNAEVLHEFQKELKKLDKKILVIYEDIDRISNPDVVREIFSISEKISNNNIKIIYQYDEFIMEKQGFDANYLEKYIPFKINLTELHFWEVLEFELKDLEETKLAVKDFNFIKYQAHQFNVLQDFFGISSEYVLNVDYVPIRKVKQMVGELLMAFEKKKELHSNHKETVISFYILKHLYSDAYRKLDIREGLLETLKFKVDDEYHTIIRLIELYKEEGITKEKIEEVFSERENQENYGILKLFKYEIINSNTYQNLERLKNSEEKATHNNEKIDRIIWNLLYEGKSVFTNYENAAKKFYDMVLTKPEVEQNQAFQDFWDYFYYSDNIVTDNTTIFKIGNPRFLELFKCFKIAYFDPDIQMKLIDFYFKRNKFEEFNLDILKCMNYCTLKTSEEYLTILDHLNSLQVVENFNEKEEFAMFINKYIHALTNLSYIHSYKYFHDAQEIIGNRDYAVVRFKELLEDLVKIKLRHEQTGLQSTVKDLKIIIVFIQKIIEIINCEEKASLTNSLNVSTEMTSRKKNQEEFNRLKRLFESNTENRVEEIDSSYNQKKITLYEVDELLKQ